jgi:hypothetical protein
MNSETSRLRQESFEIVKAWILSCERNGKVSRNTIAVGIVVLDHLRHWGSVSRDEVISSGGEIKNTRSGLGNILESYEISRSYLKEVTTRQGHQDGQRLFEAFSWGNKLSGLSQENRDQLLLDLIGILSGQAQDWLRQQNLKLNIDRRHSPSAWVRQILENSKEHSSGIVEQHLVGAKLQRRFKEIEISNHPAHAADRQTARDGDFSFYGMVYHVTATPSRNVIEKCSANLKIGKHPILVIPSEQEYRAKALAEEERIDSELTIISIESFLAINIIELATEEGKDFFSVLQEIVQIYNERLAEVETDQSLQIEVF